MTFAGLFWEAADEQATFSVNCVACLGVAFAATGRLHGNQTAVYNVRTVSKDALDSHWRVHFNKTKAFRATSLFVSYEGK